MIKYSAGFFDAEGSVWIGKGGSAIVLRAQLVQRDHTILKMLQKHWSINSNLSNDKLIFNGQHARRFYAEIVSSLSIKKYEVELACKLDLERYSRHKEETCSAWRNRIRDNACNLNLEGTELDMYTAGFLDGDGYISKIDQHVRISQKLRHPLDRMSEVYGGQVYQRNDGIHQWTIWNAQARRFLDKVRPYLLSPRHEFEWHR